MTNYIKNCSSNNKSIIILLVLLFLIIFFIIFYSNKINNGENFDNNQNLSGTFTLNSSLLNITDEENNNLLNYQKGISTDNNYKGTVYFDTKFDNIPYVYTQINTNDDGVHSVNVSNITSTSFDYKKNVVGYNNVKSETGDNMSMMALSEDNNSIFSWIAFPK
jgi:hypothetical protein